jgi:D-serine deaminase-like pyridoxal phosphate-dependent protein
MSLDLLAPPSVPTAEPWRVPSRTGVRAPRVASLSGPVAIDVDALRHNALDLVVRSSGVPIRVASKSIRVREVLDAALKLPVTAASSPSRFPKALWLAEEHDDIVLGYPSVDRAALAALAGAPRRPPASP